MVERGNGESSRCGCPAKAFLHDVWQNPAVSPLTISILEFLSLGSKTKLGGRCGYSICFVCSGSGLWVGETEEAPEWVAGGVGF